MEGGRSGHNGPQSNGHSMVHTRTRLDLQRAVPGLVLIMNAIMIHLSLLLPRRGRDLEVRPDRLPARCGHESETSEGDGVKEHCNHGKSSCTGAGAQGGGSWSNAMEAIRRMLTVSTRYTPQDRRRRNARVTAVTKAKISIVCVSPQKLLTAREAAAVAAVSAVFWAWATWASWAALTTRGAQSLKKELV